MSAFTFDEIVLQMRSQGIPLEMAERTARRELGIREPTIVTGTHISRLAEDALEDVHVDAGDKLVRALGGHVIRNSQKRASKVTPGIPDRLLFFPRHAKAVWWEAKSETGKQSSAQKHFQELCAGCGHGYIVGPLRVLEEWIVANGIAIRDTQGNLIPTKTEAHV